MSRQYRPLVRRVTGSASADRGPRMSPHGAAVWCVTGWVRVYRGSQPTTRHTLDDEDGPWICTSTRRRSSSPATGCRCSPASRRTPPAQAKAAAEQIGGDVVVKAQVKVGGRGKAGGVKFATSPEEAAKERANDILKPRRSRATSVKRILVTEASDIETEYYVSFLLDRANRTFLAMASAEGGMEIEDLAVERPEALARMPGRRPRRG